LTLTGSEQLADDDAADSEKVAITMQIDGESTAIDHNKCTDAVAGGDNDSVPADPSAFSLSQAAVPAVGGVQPSPLQCVADEYCAADEAFLQPRTPLLLREIDADEISADPVRTTTNLAYIIVRVCSAKVNCHSVFRLSVALFNSCTAV
jgi:hypothetical protein